MAETGQALSTTNSNTPPADGNVPLPQQLLQMVNPQLLRQIGLLVGLALAVAVGIGLFMWAQEPVYRPLYGRLPEQEVPAVLDALQAAGVRYKLDPQSGTVLVPARDVHTARLHLASQGLPQSGSGMGYELLQQDQRFGTSQFIESARFHRALETELARTISSIQGVESARVHLAIPKQSVFLRDRSLPSASVMVHLYSGRSLSEGQVASIVHLVASSVPELLHERVTVVDQRGRLLTRSDDRPLDATAQQLEYKQQIEEAYVRRIENLLAPMLGANRVRAQVNATLDFTFEESTQELYDPAASAVRSEQLAEEQSQRSSVGGVPGALTNQPPQAGVLAPGEPLDEADAEIVDFSRNETRNFEISKTIRHNRRPLGTIERLSLAVLVDERLVEDEEGNLVRQPLSAEELERISLLVQQAVGFDAARGDTITVISAPFEGGTGEEPTRMPWLQHPLVLEGGKLLLAAILGLVFILAVLRPLIRALFGIEDKPEEAETEDKQGDETPQLEGPTEETPQLEGPTEETPQLPGITGPTSYEDMLTAARQVVSQEPALAASVVKSWLDEDE